jgi:NTP pyrophosphatase (non-canonical NTP hydrolase)
LAGEKVMDANDYQMQAIAFDKHMPHVKIPALVMGLCSEAGEVAGELEKMYRHSSVGLTHNNSLKIIDELGDVLWNVSTLAYELGFDLRDVMDMNIVKLTRRHGDPTTVTDP